ncbi:MAG: DUF4238 domain-containing protein [Spiroplasma sp.]|nr:DUF4238 domain-containing protein [Spiroplasma sp.]
MGNGTKKQHWIPQFIIKKWTNNKSEYKFYDSHTKSFNIGNLKDSKSDIFYRDCLYENEKLFEINEIENGLSKIERTFGIIIKEKIIEQKDKIIINRLELKIIKLYWLIETYRTWVNPQRAYNLQGDFLYNNFYKDKSKEEVDQEFLQNLHYLVFDVFSYIKFNVGFLPKKLENKWQEQMQEISELLEKSHSKPLIEEEFLVNQNLLEFSQFSSNQILNNSISVYVNSCLKIIKIRDDIDYNFLLTDNRNVQFFGTSYSKLLGLTILQVMPITPRYIIAFLRLDYIDKSQPSMFAKGSFWDEKFLGLFVVNHKTELHRKKECLFELEKIINENSKIKENKKNIRLLEQELIPKYYSNKDLYYYPIYELTTKEQVHLINGMLHSQTYKYVAYSKGKDLLKAIETIKLHDIYRIEDRGKNGK